MDKHTCKALSKPNEIPAVFVRSFSRYILLTRVRPFVCRPQYGVPDHLEPALDPGGRPQGTGPGTCADRRGKRRGHGVEHAYRHDILVRHEAQADLPAGQE